MPYFPPPAAGGGSTVEVQDEGGALGSTATINFTGAGVTATGANPTTVNIPGGGGGGGSPAGNTLEVQYNNAGVFAGAANVEVESGNLALVATTEPAAVAGKILLYGREIAPDYTPLKVLRPSGVDSILQDDLAFNGVAFWQAAGTVMIGIGAGVLTVSAAGTQILPASGSARSQVQRIQYASAATAGALHTMIAPTSLAVHMLRGNVLGEGGFRYVLRFTLNALVAGNRGFWGIAASNAAATNVDPLAVAAPARIGLGFNANTGNWFICGSDGTTAWSIDLGANFPLNTTSLMELVIVCRPNNGAAGNLSYRVRRYNTAANAPAFEVSGQRTTNLPGATTLLYPWNFITNNATAAACSWQLNKAALQKDW